ncbi:ead/Ea22-like family protein [Cronobacter sakazakii]|uniref:ead/Ea22-like family protein n=1 Tax=Cronobacter sakazakii TaxID=28141 RepID=UPI0009B1B479|nr:ead/Ea22-like family protein [Cronobacter sakazakii]MDQ1933495.1 ead/Ea22-like family protein [Cronobacter sakazakii]MDQ1937909.1 ead/Ea22-like family protein [Cronobacter sakazakii]MDQ1942004.1 ead/Ea22-like family protein [Cronobacter sakazakii]MDQ1946259.1 ead/Ea22-like family protein [Cronobacter sakazakii]MDQ1950467.1 ead/Ea22-like family protein [Cronobacter sakazakii]
MMTIDTAELKAAAEKATPGRVGDRIDGSGSIKYRCVGADGSLVLLTDHKNNEYGFVGDNGEADELFFRLCTPEAVIELIAALEAAQKRIAELEARKVKLPSINPQMFNDDVMFGYRKAQREAVEFCAAAGINLETGGE